MRLVTALILAVAFAIGSSACSRNEAPAPAKAARVSATQAFERYFGPAPTTDKGTCYAFVIYFPQARQPGKVTPFPFFSFDEASLKKVALERMIAGMDEKAYQGEFLQLFPKGSRLLSLEQREGTVTANFSKELLPVAGDPAQGPALLHAVTLTLAQFSGVGAVKLQSEGRDLFPAAPAPVEGKVVQQPAAPRLLNVVAMKETAASPVQEVDALFDRPVDMKSFQFLQNDGTLLAGDVFHSMFDMAAILKPKEPGKLTPGTTVRVRFEVVDKMGRRATGEQTFNLEVKQHQQ